MDQLKTAIEWLKKHHFWVICGAVLVIGLVIWFGSTSRLAKSYSEEKGKITSTTTEVQKIFNESSHPTDVTVKAIDNERKDLKKEVGEAWSELLERQKQYTKWPDALGREFVQDVSNLDADAPIPDKHLATYQALIPEYLRKLLIERINVRREKFATPEEGGHGGPTRPSVDYGEGGLYGPGAAPYGRSSAGELTEEDLTGIVIWPTDEARTTASIGSSGPEAGPGSSSTRTGDTKRSDIVGKYKNEAWQSTPSTKMVREAQEDIWIYQDLLDVIAKTNENATGPHDAAVGRIKRFEIGAETEKAWKDAKEYLGIPTGGTGAAGPGGMPAGAEGMPPGGASAGEMMPQGSPMGEGESPYMMGRGRQGAQWRYVDTKGKPIAAGDPQPFPQFRLMPFHLQVVIDQKEVPRLLLAMANAPLPTEVAHWAINPDDCEFVTFKAPDPTQSANPWAAPELGTQRVRRQKKSGPGMEGGTGLAYGKEQETKRAGDVTLDLLGYVYLFNPVDPQFRSGEEGQAKEGAPSSGQPAGTPGPGTATAPPTAPSETPATPPGTPATPAEAAGTPAGPATPAPAGPAPAATGPSSEAGTPTVAPPG